MTSRELKRSNDRLKDMYEFMSRGFVNAPNGARNRYERESLKLTSNLIQEHQSIKRKRALYFFMMLLLAFFMYLIYVYVIIGETPETTEQGKMYIAFKYLYIILCIIIVSILFYIVY